MDPPQDVVACALPVGFTRPPFQCPRSPTAQLALSTQPVAMNNTTECPTTRLHAHSDFQPHGELPRPRSISQRNLTSAATASPGRKPLSHTLWLDCTSSPPAMFLRKQPYGVNLVLRFALLDSRRHGYGCSPLLARPRFAHRHREGVCTLH